MTVIAGAMTEMTVPVDWDLTRLNPHGESARINPSELIGCIDNKMLDTINTKRYRIVAQKYTKIKAANTGTTGGNFGGTGSGLNTVWNYESLSRATTCNEDCQVLDPGHQVHTQCDH